MWMDLRRCGRIEIKREVYMSEIIQFLNDSVNRDVICEMFGVKKMLRVN